MMAAMMRGSLLTTASPDVEDTPAMAMTSTMFVYNSVLLAFFSMSAWNSPKAPALRSCPYKLQHLYGEKRNQNNILDLKALNICPKIPWNPKNLKPQTPIAPA